MATTFDSTVRVRDDRKFFFVMACAMAATIVAGFSFNLAAGRSSFSVPLIFHVHGLVFLGWIALYLVQSGLIFTGSVALHRRLGWLAALWVPLMVALGISMTLVSLRRGGPPFFDQNEFLFGNTIGILSFAALVAAAVVLRRRTDWHRRLMFCAMASLTGPGFGRLLPAPFLIPWAWWVVALAFPLIFPLIGVVADLRRNGRAHPAWAWGVAGMAGAVLIGDLIAYSPLGYAVTKQVIAGTPGAERSMKAFFPS